MNTHVLVMEIFLFVVKGLGDDDACRKSDPPGALQEEFSPDGMVIHAQDFGDGVGAHGTFFIAEFHFSGGDEPAGATAADSILGQVDVIGFFEVRLNEFLTFFIDDGFAVGGEAQGGEQDDGQHRQEGGHQDGGHWGLDWSAHVPFCAPFCPLALLPSNRKHNRIPGMCIL